MKVLLIDDEPKARKLLEVLLQENCFEVTEIFTAKDLLSGVELIKKESPKIVFLDIEMPEHSGLEIFDFIDCNAYNFEIIFTTAYSEYAVQAFELSAIDYLLKPLREDKLKEAVEKAIKNLGKSQINLKLEELRKGLQTLEFNKIGLPITDGIKFVNFNDIIMLKADGMYALVYLVDSNPVLLSKPLKYFTGLIEGKLAFYKPHRSYLINLKHIKQYYKKDGGYIVMDNDEMVSISKDKKDEFLTIIEGIA